MFKKCVDSYDTWLCSRSGLTAVTRNYVQEVCWQLWHVIMFKKCADNYDTWLCSRSVLTAVTRDYVQEVCWQLWHVIMFKKCADSCDTLQVAGRRCWKKSQCRPLDSFANTTTRQERWSVMNSPKRTPNFTNLSH